MDSQPQDGAVRRSCRWALVAAILVVGGLAAGEARGDIHVYVLNCIDSSGSVQADAYDAKDSVEVVAASSKSFSTNESDSLHCAGEGEGYCRMVFTPKSSPDRCYSASGGETRMHIDSGKWAVISGFEITEYCYPVVKQYDSKPNCQDVCGNCH